MSARTGATTAPPATRSRRFYATTATAYDGAGYWIALFRAAQGDEVNMNTSFAYFPYSQFLGGLASNGSEADSALNNTAITSIIGSPGIRVGTEFQNTATAGQYLLNLTALGGSAANGILLVSGAKNEDNYALSRANADGTFSIFCHDNGVNGAAYEADPVAFVYLPASAAGANTITALGRVRSGATTSVAGGTFTIAKGGTGQWYLSIPGKSPGNGTLLVSAEGGGTNNVDNVVSALWDAPNSRWIIESRDLSGDTALPTLQNGATTAEEIFSFAFFTNAPANLQPTATLTGPPPGTAVVQGGANLPLTATASDTGGTIAKVQFFDGNTLLGEDTTAPYTLAVNPSSLTLGWHSLFARATDNGGGTGTSSATTVLVQPPAGAGGLFFDGVNDYVTFGNEPELGLDSFTLECWFFRVGSGLTASSGSGGVAVEPLISKGRGESDGSDVDCNYIFGIQGSSGKLAADFEDSSTGLNHPIVGTTVVPTGVWQHAAVTFDANTFEWRIYLNGKLEISGSTNGLLPRSDSIQHSALGSALNSLGASEGAFLGMIDEARIWNTARTQVEIQQTINLGISSAPGLVARWAMSEGTGTTLTSTATTVIAGTLVNGPSWTTGAPFDATIAPAVAITSPVTNATLLAPATFTVEATAIDTDGSIVQVEFLRDGVPIGTDTTFPYSVPQSSLGSGIYVYTARATDNTGLTATSLPVTVNVNFDPLHPPANTALRFDGVDDYVTMGVAPEFGLGGPPSNGLTIECWFRKEGAGITSGSGSGGVTGVPLFGKGRGESDGSNVDCDYFFGINAAGQLVADFETYPAAGLTSGQNYPVTATNTPIVNGAWYHAAATYDGATATWKLYLNGAQVGSAAAAAGARPRFDSIQHFGIATALNSTGTREGAFAGRIDEVRLWNYARSAAEILAAKDTEISSAPGLVGRYGLNEAAGTAVYNSVAVTGAPVGNFFSSPVWVDGAPFTTINTPPVVTLDAPVVGATSVYPYAFTFAASATDAGGTIARVEFYVDGTKVGEDTTAPYTYAWIPPAVGSYSVIARSIDNLGAADTSAPVVLSVTPNPNQPPVVSLTAPANNATGIGAATTLTLGIADPEADGVNVTFYGRKTVPAAPSADFTVVALPDTQYYSENTPNTRFAQFLAQTNWIVSQKDARNVAFVTHMGDIVDDGDSIPQQWVNANQAMTILENHSTTLRAYGLPFGAAPGNHDQSINGDPNSPSTYYNQYFGVSRYVGRPYWGGNYGVNNDNNYQLFSASGLDFIILHLEYRTSADPAVIAWADALLKAHPHRRAIVTSHWIIGQGNPASFGGQGQQIYDGLKNNPNLFLLLCGHIHAEGRRSDTYQGRTVYSVLQDYQATATGGSGFLRMFTFSPANNTITVESYSPTLNRAVNASDGIPGFGGTFVLPYNMQASVSDWIPLGTATVAPGGTTATLAWTGLEKSSHYEWRAVVSDGINTTTSATSRFSTAAAFAPTITLVTPAVGVNYTAPAAIALKAVATDADGSIARVDFFLGTTKLGQDTTAPYEFTAPAQPAGTYAFSAVAVDNENRASLSAVVNVTVLNRVNTPPTVALTAPAAGPGPQVPGTITVAANANDPDGAVAKVVFYDGATPLGEDSTAPYSFNWTTATPGNHQLTADAHDNDNAVTVSAPVDIVVGFTPAAALLDNDGDLILALTEFALGLSDNTANRAGLPTLGIDAGRLTLTFNRARAELTYTVQASSDLKTWTDLATNPGAVGANVTVIDPDTTSPNRYLRLRVGDGVSLVHTLPLGRMTYALPTNQETAVSFPLEDALGAIAGRPAGFITAVGANTLDSTGAGWTAGQLSQSATPYLVRIIRGAAVGRMFPVDTATANTDLRLTLATAGVDLTTLGIVAGTDTFELIPADTLATLFPTGTLLSGTVATGDTLRLWEGTAWATFFHDGADWQRQGGGAANHTLVRPDHGWMLRRRGPAKTFVLLGQASSTVAKVSIPRGGSAYVSLLPVAATFAEFPLQTLLPGWSSNPANVTAGDYVSLWNGSLWLNYYYNSATAKWLRQGVPTDAGTTVLLKPGRPVLINRPAGSGTDILTQAKTY